MYVLLGVPLPKPTHPHCPINLHGSCFLLIKPKSPISTKILKTRFVILSSILPRRRSTSSIIGRNRGRARAGGGWDRLRGGCSIWMKSKTFFDVSVQAVSLPFITKTTLWGDPISSPNNYGIVVIYGFVMSKVAFSKSGDSKWTDIGGARDDYCDIVCSKHYVFALSDVGSVENLGFD
ncbi:hypothetical protein Acr_08g0001860 [Actinidia rufa]|uniref:KIB1-4 beta-propeller domain-containing protein n=1 Tax=Actinidia rufa TaxID=165716 RepID=A0A7J0EZD7_9ERIC|nr:hypothetical protein Acr_08g0001860 [Actinidia rufa]